MLCTDLLRHSRLAIIILATSNGDLKSRFSAAMSEFVVTLIEPDRWPDDPVLLERARKLDNDCRSLGDFNATVNALDAKALRILVEELIDIACEIEREIGRHYQLEQV
jgi:hypothetical protein